MSKTETDSSFFQHQADDYSIAIICPAGVKLAPLVAMLDERHPSLSTTSRSQNTYDFGRIAHHNVVLAVVPEIGYDSAAVVVAQLLNDFEYLRFGLLVGVGGGIPDEDYDSDDKNIDIRLGDVVVSDPSGTFGGVVQFDRGKIVAGKQFQRTGTLIKPPAALGNTMRKLAALHKINGNGIEKNLAQMLKENPYMEEEYSCPGANNDQLFKSSYPHLSGNKTCRQCDTSHTITRIQRKTKGPRIYYGTIGSSNLVINDSTARNKLREELGIICVEMEAAGLDDAFPCLVIRGICDYADSHKNKKWQPYAAATAAAYAKELLQHIPHNEVEGTQTLEALRKVYNERFPQVSEKLDGVRPLASEAKTVVEGFKVNESYYQRYLNWLSPPDPSTNFNKAIRQRHEESGQWFLRSAAYSAWMKDRSSFLWLNGIPGCGKTILSSAIINNLQENKACCDGLLYFYFDFSDFQKQSLENLVRSLIAQLFCKRKKGVNHLRSLHFFCGLGMRQPNIESLFMTLNHMIQQAGEVWIVLDALDECQKRKENASGGIFSWLQSLRDSQMNIHLLVTSRLEQDIEEIAGKWTQKEIVNLQSELIGNDIRSYIKSRVRDSKGLQRWKTRPDIQDEIETSLIKNAKGMFRWVSCQFDALEMCIGPQEIRKALKNLPKTLDETYARILNNIPSEHRNQTKRILQFLSFSERPLRLDEAVDVIAVDTTSRPRFDPKNRIPVPAVISRYCPSLVVIVTRKDAFNDVNGSYEKVHKEKTVTEIQLAHFSVKEYLLSDRLCQSVANDFRENFEEITARASIAEVCLAYLLELDRTYKLNEIESSYPLAKYSARYWACHAMVAESYSKTFLTPAMELFSNPTSFETCWQLYPLAVNQKSSPLSYASRMGLFYSAQELIHGEVDVNARECYNNALQAASYGGHDKIVKLLLEKGADVNALDDYYGNALQAASDRGHDKIIQLLLDKGANVNTNVNAKGICGRSSLYAAAYRGHSEIVQLLLENGANINAHRCRPFLNSLTAASRGGHDKIVQILLEKGAEVNAQTECGHYGSALQAATYHGHDTTVQLLLEKGANINAQGGRYSGNALYYASSQGHNKIVQLLLEKGANVNDQGGYYGNALHAASEEGHDTIAQLLLEKGANANAQGGCAYRENALYAASNNGHDEIVQLLLENGADVNAQGGCYQNALRAASCRGHDKIVKLLLEKGADINAQGGEGWNALHSASRNGHDKIVQFLLEKGADVNSHGGLYGNVVYAASRNGHDKIVQLLLENGADVNAQRGDFDNALQAASCDGHDKIVKLLLGKVADINARGNYHGNAL